MQTGKGGTKGSEQQARPGRAPHRRSHQAQTAVLRAADDLLVERGYAGVTIEGIAERAGVAKQTIYRWWPSKGDVLLDTLIDDAGEFLSVPNTGSVREDVRRHLRKLSRFLTKEASGKVMLALIGEAQHNSEMAHKLRHRYLDPSRREERAMLERGIERGELASDFGIDAALDAIYGPVLYRALLRGGAIPKAFTDGLVESVLGPDTAD
jgi:AcrR family transcriptional regulator